MRRQMDMGHQACLNRSLYKISKLPPFARFALGGKKIPILMKNLKIDKK